MFTEGGYGCRTQRYGHRIWSVNPARNAGIKIGDVVMRISDKRGHSNEQVGEIVEGEQGRNRSKISLKRKNEPT